MTELNAPGEQDIAGFDLRGSWQKADPSDGDLAYPDFLDLTVVQPGAGQYLGRKGRPQQGFLRWDAGSWRLTQDGRIEISTATDAIESWPVEVSDDELQIHAADCVLIYRRRSGLDD